jgi:Peptidase S46.
MLCLYPVKSEPIKPFNEGMWLMLLNEQVDFSELKRMGLTLSPEQIYNADKKSLKDAIVMLGSGFCSGSVISPEGLVLTNHHKRTMPSNR